MNKFVDWVDWLNEQVGRYSQWLLLLMVVVTFAIVLLRYLLGLGWVWLQEVVVYSHAIVFLLWCPMTLLKDGHVRVDIRYRSISKRGQLMVNCLGSVLLLLPMCGLIWYQAFPYVMDSWQVFEGSRDSGGIPGVFILKSFILVFAALTGLQGVSLAWRSWTGLKNVR